MAACKLCRQEHQLVESHFLPAAVYAQFRNEAEPNPVVITKQVSQATSRQIKDFLLCAECEGRFSKFGETWVLGNMARAEGFKLQHALLDVQPIAASETFACYSTVGVQGIDMDALVYFGMSIFWRASTHRWKNASGPMEGIDLGPFEESLRQFLLGGPFPENTVTELPMIPSAQSRKFSTATSSP